MAGRTARDPIAEVLRLDAHREPGWRRVHDELARRRQRLVDDLVRGAPPDHYAYQLVVGQIRGLDDVLAAIKKEFVNA